MSFSLHSASVNPIRLRDVRIVGEGAGSVLTLAESYIAPYASGSDHSLAGGWYQAVPPAISVNRGRECSIQPLEPVGNNLIPPKGEARLALRVRMTGDGAFDIRSLEVRYQEADEDKIQQIPFGWEGRAASGVEGHQVGNKPGPGCDAAIRRGDIELLPF